VGVLVGGGGVGGITDREVSNVQNEKIFQIGKPRANFLTLERKELAVLKHSITTSCIS